jgi:hypothetical protein
MMEGFPYYDEGLLPFKGWNQQAEASATSEFR